MRIESNAALSFSSKSAATGSGQVTVFVQAAIPDDLLPNIRKALDPFARQNDADEALWTLVHIDLGGGGEGAPFMVMMRICDDTAAGVNADGVFLDVEESPDSLEESPVLLPSSGSQSEALQANSRASFRRARQFGFAADSPPFPDSWTVGVLVLQTLLAGGSSGSPFMNLLAGEREAEGEE